MVSSQDEYPQVLLFDIGGVCVVSPFQAILDYEKRNNIPLGWINTSIAASSATGWWARLERGEIPLDATFFRGFRDDLTDENRWRQYVQAGRRKSTEQRDEKQGTAAGSREAATQQEKSGEESRTPPVPDIDAEWLYWEMMRISREMDPNMFPALKKLRQVADERARDSGRKLVIGALSNTSIFPPGHPFMDETTPEGKRQRELKGIFDVFVSSAHVGMRKPAEDIYKYAITRLHEFVKLKNYGMGVRPQDITFLDDIGGNLRTAKTLGMNTLKVQLGRTDKAVSELEKLTGLNLQGDKSRL